MIISCPACSARYRVAEDKIQGRGARISCPTCAHKFVLYKGDGKLVVGDPEPRVQGLPVTIARNGELRRQVPSMDEEEAPTTLMPHGSTAERRMDGHGGSNPEMMMSGRLPAAAPSAPVAEPSGGSRGPVLLAVVAILVGAGMFAMVWFG